MIQLKNVTIQFHEETVLDNWTVNFEKGKIYGITGRNGCGKSILFKMICGFKKPNCGNVQVNGINLYDQHVFPDHVAALIERPKFLDNLSGFDNLMMIASIKNKIGKEEILNIMHTVGIRDIDIHKLYQKYSLGTKQKLGIAQVLMEDDDILIFDEPFNGLDDTTVTEIRNLIASKKNKNRIILLSSHIKEDIEVLCDIVYKIDGGKLIRMEESL